MKKSLSPLAVILVAQVVLAVVLQINSGQVSSGVVEEPLFNIGTASLEQILIAGPDDQSVELEKKQDAWVLPDKAGLPVADGRVERLLKSLVNLQRGLPVATRESAHDRFKVGENAFERRITFNNGRVRTLYLGTSPGVGRIHARLGKSDTVYAVNFSAHQVPAEPDDWLDKTLLQVPSDSVNGIEVVGLSFVRSEASSDEKSEASPVNESKQSSELRWQAKNLAEGLAVADGAVNDLVAQLSRLRIQDVVTDADSSRYGFKESLVTLTLTRDNGDVIEYRLGKIEAEKENVESRYALKVSTRPQYFRIDPSTAEAIIEAAKRENLLSKTTSAETSSVIEAVD